MQKHSIVTSKEFLCILCSLQKFHHYCITHRASMITDKKLLVAENNIICPLIQHKNPIQTRTTTVPSRLVIQAQPWDWQRQKDTWHGHKHTCNRTIYDIQECMKTEEIWLVTIHDEHIYMLSNYILLGWPSMKAEVQREVEWYWSFIDKIVVIGRITMKGRWRIIIPTLL